MQFEMFWKCLFSPSLYMIHRTHWEKYHPNDWERVGDQLLNTFAIVWNLSLYTSPILVSYVIRGYMNIEGVISLSKITFGLSLIMGTTYCIRSFGRASNADYKMFVTKYSSVKGLRSRPSTAYKHAEKIKAIKSYDFDFNAWPVEYEYDKHVSTRHDSRSPRSTLSSLAQSPCSIVGYLVLHTFGIRMIYPGSTSILNYLLSSTLMDGRKALLETMNGKRFKIKTIDGNFIDTMFVNKRGAPSNDSTLKSETLVICSEGNAGFYENGIMSTAVESGYSVLGWNHPGFGCSTGMPYLDQEQNAIDAVVQFAIKKLGFAETQIILYGWSIGGYSTAWAAINYPNIKAVVLDATFDDILPLALNQMPELIEYIVKLTIRTYSDLNVARLLVKYHGPIKMVRRTEDEIICIRPGDLSTNRGNFLLKKILSRRFPKLLTHETEAILEAWLETSGSERERLMEAYKFDKEYYSRILKKYGETHGHYPYWSFGEKMSVDEKTCCLLYLAENYMVDYRSTHCTPLPNNIFHNLLSNI